MINNSTQIKSLLKFEPGLFYFVQIFKRRKDNPDMAKDMMVIDNFYIYTEEQFDKYMPRIIEICNLNNDRAYIRLNRRSDKKIALQMLSRIASMVAAEQYNVKNVYNSIAGEYHAEEDKTWIIDIDSKDNKQILQIKLDIDSCMPFGTDKIVAEIPTKNGIHLITKPFDLRTFKDKYEIDIHKDNPTILYSPQ